jgi:insertion element IS1 protein InsB
MLSVVKIDYVKCQKPALNADMKTSSSMDSFSRNRDTNAKAVTISSPQPTNRERGKPKWMKVMTILLYVSGLSMNAIAQLFNVSAQAVLNWVRDYAKTHCKKPEPGSAVIVELDEFWHFIESKKKSYGYGKLMNACGTQAIVIEVDSLTGNWEVVNGYATLRYRQTLRKLLDRLAQWQVTVYCTDHWEAYASELEEHPEAHHVETKTETRNIERNNMASPRFAIRSSSLVCQISS